MYGEEKNGIFVAVSELWHRDTISVTVSELWQRDGTSVTATEVCMADRWYLCGCYGDVVVR